MFKLNDRVTPKNGDLAGAIGKVIDIFNVCNDLVSVEFSDITKVYFPNELVKVEI